MGVGGAGGGGRWVLSGPPPSCKGATPVVGRRAPIPRPHHARHAQHKKRIRDAAATGSHPHSRPHSRHQRACAARERCNSYATHHHEGDLLTLELRKAFFQHAQRNKACSRHDSICAPETEYCADAESIWRRVQADGCLVLREARAQSARRTGEPSLHAE
jgi:hypothetical protein